MYFLWLLFDLNLTEWKVNVDSKLMLIWLFFINVNSTSERRQNAVEIWAPWIFFFLLSFDLNLTARKVDIDSNLTLIWLFFIDVNSTSRRRQSTVEIWAQLIDFSFTFIRPTFDSKESQCWLKVDVNSTILYQCKFDLRITSKYCQNTVEICAWWINFFSTFIRPKFDSKESRCWV